MNTSLSRRDSKTKSANRTLHAAAMSPQSLIVIGACAVLSVSSAAAELSIYGVGHASADAIRTDPGSSSYIHSNSSRLGFKGSQDIGNGAVILFQYESGVDLTGKGNGDGNGGANSGGQVFTRARDSFVGIKSALGTVMIGRVGGLNQWLYDYNLFGDQVGDLGNIWGGDGLPGRLDHAASYRTPDFGGLSLSLTYAPSQGISDSKTYIAKPEYANGGIKLGAAYANVGNGIGSPDTKAAAITASYNAGAFNVGGGLQRETDIGGMGGADRNKVTLGAGVKVGANGIVKAQYARAGDLSGTANTRAKQWAVGFDYSWDKNTTLYAAYAKTKNDSAAAYTSYDYGHGDQGVPALGAGSNPTAISVGVVYKFDAGLLR